MNGIIRQIKDSKMWSLEKKKNYFMTISDEWKSEWEQIVDETHQQDDKSTQKSDVSHKKKTNVQRWRIEMKNEGWKKLRKWSG